VRRSARSTPNQIGDEFRKLCIYRRSGFVFHGPVVMDQPMSERSQLGSAARRATVLGLDYRFVEHAVQFVDQQPCATIGHSHGSPGCRDGAVVADGFEQPDLPMPDCLTGCKI